MMTTSEPHIGTMKNHGSYMVPPVDWIGMFYLAMHVTCCCFLTLTFVKDLESVATQRCWSPRKIRKPSEIKIRPGNTTLSHLKTHEKEKGEQVKSPMCKLISHSRGYPLNYSIEFPRAHN